MIIDQVGIFYSDQPSETEPSYFLPRSQVRDLKAQKLGGFINHGKHFRLTKLQELDERESKDASVKARDRSAQMPPSITEQYVDGHKGAVAIVEAWA